MPDFVTTFTTPPGRTSKLRRKRIRDDLKLLHCFLTDSRARCVHGVVSVVGAVNLDQIRATTLAAEVQTGRGRWSNRTAVVTTDCRSRQRKREIVSFVDRQVVDALLIDRGRDCGLGSLNYFRRRIGNRDDFADLSRLECDVDLRGLSDGDSNLRQHGFFEVRRFDSDLIIAGWNVDDAIETFVVSGRVRETFVPGLRAVTVALAHNRARGVFHSALHIGSV